MQKKGITVFSEKLVKIIVLLRQRSNEIVDIKSYYLNLPVLGAVGPCRWWRGLVCSPGATAVPDPVDWSVGSL